jgi:2-haloacid dehalogenase
LSKEFEEVANLKKYEIFLFDADDTLYDFDKSEEYALRSMFGHCGFSYSESVLMKYRKISAESWAAYEKGELSVADFPIIRFARLFDELGTQHDADKANVKYLAELGKGTFLIDGAKEICKAIVSSNKQIFIVTNGLLAVQKARIKHSLLKDYISESFVSSAIGYMKPDIEFFEHVFSKIPKVSKERILIIGDSLTADIAGGNTAGIDTCWFNEKGETNHTDINPT